jgi:hypothetical protein
MPSAVSFTLRHAESLSAVVTQTVTQAGKGYKIMKEFDQAICYTLDLSCTKKPYVMRMLEVRFGKNIARRM